MKTLALDIGKVCIELHPERALTAFGLEPDKPYPEDVQRFVQAYHRGKMDSEEFALRLREAVGLSCPVEEIHRRWDLTLGEGIPETALLVKGLLARGWRAVFFSDIQPWHTEALPRVISFFDQVEGGIYSHIVGAEKPSEEMYLAFEAQYGKPALYVDDRQCNIEAGLARGWKAVQYTPEVGRTLLQEIDTL